MDLQHTPPATAPAAPPVDVPDPVQVEAGERLRDILADVRSTLAEILNTQDDLARRVADLELRYADTHHALIGALNRAARAESYLEPFLRSRLQRSLWSLGLPPRPQWLPQYTSRPPLPSPPERSPLSRDLSETAARVSTLCRRIGRQLTTAVAIGPESEMDIALQHLFDKGFRPRVILDVGSAKGFWSERAQWLHFTNADYYLIDPLDESQPHLRELARRSPKFHPLQLAIGSEPGQLVMNVTPDPDGSSLLAFPSDAAADRRTVPVETLDNLLGSGRVASPDLVKVDVQGFEIDVLRGASKLFGRVDVFIIEVNLFRFVPTCPLAHEVVAFMADRGYRLYDLAGSLRRPFDDDLGQLDLVFVRNESPLVASNRWK